MTSLKFMKNNRGFSLVELLAVIAIGAVLMGGTAISMNFLNYGDVTKCTRNINDAIRNLKVDSLSRSTRHCYLVIRWDAGKEAYYMIDAVSKEELDETNWDEKALSLSLPEKIGTGKITISYTDRTDGTGMEALRDEIPLIISFKAESGAFLSEWKQINITSKEITSTIHMVTKTGNHYID